MSDVFRAPKPAPRPFQGRGLGEGCDRLRAEARARGGVLIYDCLNARVVGQRVTCHRGHTLAKVADRGIRLSRALEGLRPFVCQQCADFEPAEGLP